MSVSNTPSHLFGPLLCDPLEAVGPSVFLQIVANLPLQDLVNTESVCRAWHSNLQSARAATWRPRAKLSTEKKHYDMLLRLERAASGSWTGEPGTEEPTPPEGQGAIDWKDICKANERLRLGWKWGRCGERWITPPGAAAWRFKVDREEGTMLSTSIDAGLHVIDLETSRSLFHIRAVRPWAHLEFANGYAVFDDGIDGSTIQVFRTQRAIDRSSVPPPSPSKRPHLVGTCESSTEASWDPQTDWAKDSTRLSRGHLSWYRTVSPPIRSIAFRARVDHKDVEGRERAVLATAGEEAVHLWDLEREGKAEVIEIKPADRCSCRYIEFDEDHVFLCSAEQIHIYSRQTKQKLLSYPPPDINLRDAIACAFYFDSSKDNTIIAQPSKGISVDRTRAAPLRMANVSKLEHSGRWSSDPRCGELMLGTDKICLGRADKTPMDFQFSACHFTDSDLVCTSIVGTTLIIRDFKYPLSLPTEKARTQAVAERTIYVGSQGAASLLSTDGSRIAIATVSQVVKLSPDFQTSHVVLLETTLLPELPRLPSIRAALSDQPYQVATDDQRPTITAHAISSIVPLDDRHSSCLQMDRKCLYLTYWAGGEAQAGEAHDPLSGAIVAPPAEATIGYGVCVKCWDFTPAFDQNH